MHGRSTTLRLIVLSLLVSACGGGDETTIYNTPPNSIYGRVTPATPETRIAAWQAQEVASTLADSAGYFSLRSLEPGLYRLVIASPSGYHGEVPEVSVGPQDGVSVGVVALTDSPGILLSYTPARNAPALLATEVMPTLTFGTPMRPSSFATQVEIVPPVTGQWFAVNGSNARVFQFQAFPSFAAGEEYEIRLLPGLLTATGEPWGESFSFPIRTLPFILTGIVTPEDTNLQDFPPLPPTEVATVATLSFTMPLDRSTIAGSVSSDPPLDLTALPVGSGTTRSMTLSVAGPLTSGTTYHLTVRRQLHDHNGDPLAVPEAIVLRTQPFRVAHSTTYPDVDNLAPGYSGFVYEETYNTSADPESFVDGLSIAPTGPELEVVTVPLQSASVRTIRVQLGNLRPGTDYVLRMSPDLVSRDGARLGQERLVSIRTQELRVAGATISTADPYFTRNGEVNPDDAINFSLSFNYPVALAALPTVVEFEPPIAGRWYAVSQSFAVSNYRFYPDQPNTLAPGSVGRMRVLAGVPLVDDISLAEETVAEYLVLPLVIVTAHPPRGSTVDRSVVVRISFNARMDKSATQAAFTLVDEDGETVGGAFSWVQADRYLEFQPYDLQPGHVTARLGTGARSATGVPLTTSWESDFNVRP